eukprot:1351927-Amorphochlora_amoeboformis.AAC.1
MESELSCLESYCAPSTRPFPRPPSWRPGSPSWTSSLQVGGSTDRLGACGWRCHGECHSDNIYIRYLDNSYSISQYPYRNPGHGGHDPDARLVAWAYPSSPRRDNPFAKYTKTMTEMEFGGPLGVTAMMFGLPITIFGLFLFCNDPEESMD